MKNADALIRANEAVDKAQTAADKAEAAVPEKKKAAEDAKALYDLAAQQWNAKGDYDKSTDTKGYAALQALAKDFKTKQAAYETSIEAVTTANNALGDAQRALAIKQKETSNIGGPSNKDAEALGKGLVKGVFEGLGFDSDIFGGKNIKPFTEWGIFKLMTGLVGYASKLGEHMGEAGPIGGPLSLPGSNSPGNVARSGLLGLAESIIPGIDKVLAPKGDQGPLSPMEPSWVTSSMGQTTPGPDAPHAGSGANPGPTINMTGVDLSPGAVTGALQQRGLIAPPVGPTPAAVPVG